MNCNYKVKITDIQTKYKFKVFCTGYDDSEIKEKIDTMYQAWPKASGEGETPTLDNTANATMSIDLKGNTSQETTTGNNLLNIYLQKNAGDSATNNGITYTINNDGSVTLNGTASAQSTYYVFSDRSDSFTSGSYTLYGFRNDSKIMTGLGINTDAGYKYMNAFENVSTANYTNPVLNYLVLRVNEGVTINNEKVYPMLVSGTYTKTTFPEFELYTNGASPNPDYPQDVHVVTGDNTIKLEGKNLFNSYASMSEGFLPATGSYPTTNSTFPNAKYQLIELKAGESLTTSGSTSGQGRVRYIDKENNVVLGSVIEQGSTANEYYTSTGNYSSGFVNATITAKQDIIIGVMLLRGGEDLSRFQVEKNSIATTYEPYQSQSYAVNLGTLELCKIGDYQDYFYKENKKWYKYSAIGKVVLGGSENWQQSGTYTNNTIYSVYSGVITNYNYGQAISDLFIWNNNISPSTITEYIATGGDTLRIGVLKSRLSAYTINEFKTWLSNNNVTVYYVLATPTNTEITDTTLISQLNALAGAESYSGQTNISQVNNDKPFIITAKALKDLSNL